MPGDRDDDHDGDDDGRPPPKWVAWKSAIRPHTLTASLVPVLVGHSLALRMIALFAARAADAESVAAIALLRELVPSLSLAWSVFCCLIQVATNLHNDYADFVKGADTDERVGQARATQKGWLTPDEVCRACVMCLGAALAVGAALLTSPSSPLNFRGDGGSDAGVDPVALLVILSSAFNAVAYTGGPFPLGYIGLGWVSIGYNGLGDAFAFLYFGLVATAGVPYLCAKRLLSLSTSVNGGRTGTLLSETPFLSSLRTAVPIGLLATAIIVVNNLRDRHTDVKVGKRTLAVRFGERFARMEYLALIAGSYLWCFAECYWKWRERKQWKGDGSEESLSLLLPLLPLLSLPLSVPELKAVAFGGKDGGALNEHVGRTAKLQLAYGALLALGIVIDAYHCSDV